MEAAVEPRTASLTRALIVVVVLAAVGAASFLGAVTLRLGHLPSLAGSSRLAAAAPSLRAGDLEFSYDRGWTRTAASALPADIGGGASTRVVAGLCPGGCASGVDVTYVLFGEGGANFPQLGVLARGFDRSFPRQFRGFDRIGSGQYQTADGVRYLRYEFRYRRGAQRWHEVLGAYRVAGRAVIVMARGPEADFTAHRARVLRVLGDARLAS